MWPTTALAQPEANAQPDVDEEVGGTALTDGSGIGNLGSPSAKAQARHTRERQAPGWDPYTIRDEPWFLDDRARQELGLKEEQVEPLYENYDAVWQRHKERQAKLAAGREEDKYEEIPEREELERAGYANDFEREFRTAAGNVLTPQQQQRYGQLYNQYRGINAFSDPDYLEYYDFDRRQLAGIHQLRRNYNRRMAELSRFEGSPEQRQQAYQNLRRQTAADLDGLMNDRQRQAMRERNGRPFEFSADNHFGTASDIEGRQRNARGQNRQNVNPGSGVGTPQNRAQGSGIGVPQPNAPNAGASSAGGGAGASGSGAAGGGGASGGAGAGGGTAGDIDNN